MERTFCVMSISSLFSFVKMAYFYFMFLLVFFNAFFHNFSPPSESIFTGLKSACWPNFLKIVLSQSKSTGTVILTRQNSGYVVWWKKKWHTYSWHMTFSWASIDKASLGVNLSLPLPRVNLSLPFPRPSLEGNSISKIETIFIKIIYPPPFPKFMIPSPHNCRRSHKHK